MTTSLETYQNQVAELYIVFFGRAPEAEGMNHWVQALKDGLTMSEIGAHFEVSAEYQSRYLGLSSIEGSLYSTEQIKRFYQNTFERDTDPEGLDYWLKQIQQGKSLADVAVAKVQAAFVGGDGISPSDTAILRNKVEVAKYVSVTLASNDADLVDGAFDGVTAEPGSVTSTEARLAAQAAGRSGRVIEGDDQAQTLTGGPGPDTITGGTSDDTIVGEAGADFLTGGQGGDVFAYASGATGEKLSTADRITDFEPGVDKIKTNLPNFSWTEVLIEDSITADINDYGDFVSKASEAFDTGYPVYVVSNPIVGETWVAINNGGSPLEFGEGDSLIVLEGIQNDILLSGTDFIQ